jgi:hypothetical protein
LPWLYWYNKFDKDKINICTFAGERFDRDEFDKDKFETAKFVGDRFDRDKFAIQILNSEV